MLEKPITFEAWDRRTAWKMAYELLFNEGKGVDGRLVLEDVSQEGPSDRELDLKENGVPFV